MKAGQRPDTLETIRQQIAQSEERRKKQRFEFNMRVLSQGDVQVLGSEEFVADLTDAIAEDLLEKEQIHNILGTVIGALVSPDRSIRERALTILTVATTDLLQGPDREDILLVGRGVCRWLEYEEQVLPGFAVAVKRLEELVQWLIRQALWQDVLDIVTLLARIRSGELGKVAAIRSMSGGCLANLATEETVNRLCDFCLGECGSESESFLGVLRSLGHHGLPFLLNRCIRSTVQEERKGLLRLARTVAGGDFPLFAAELLAEPIPEEVLMDFLVLAAEQDGEELYPALQHSFAHSNRRIQHEMIRLTVKLGGGAMPDRLMIALQMVHASLKIIVIRLLAEHAGKSEKVLSALIEFIEGRDFFPPAFRKGLLQAVVVALRAFPSRESVALLVRLQRECAGEADWERLGLQIDRSLKILTPRLRHNRRAKKEDDEVEFDTDPLARQRAGVTVAKLEEEVRKILRKGDGRGASRFLFQQARAAGEKNDFIVAEKLRDRMIEVDPMSMDEAVELGEWLERQKKAAVEPLYSDAWRDLAPLMPQMALKALHRVMRLENYRKDEELVLTGESDESLYFLTSGLLGLMCRSGKDERFLKRMKPGAVFGGSQFFAASVWTYSLWAISEVQVHVLRRTDFQPIAVRFPELAHTLRRYCAQNEETIAGLLRTTGEDRRGYPRFAANILLINSLLDPYGAGESRDFQGELMDISRGGLSFAVKITGDELARLMLGREIATVIQADGKEIVRCRGIIVGVRQQDPAVGSYSIHVRLAGTIAENAFGHVLSLMNK